MDLTEHISNIEKAIEYAQKDKSLELEMLFKSNGNNKVNTAKFTKLISKLKGMSSVFISKIIQQESLDITFEDKSINTRITLLTKSAIQNYCKNNNLKSINPKEMIFQDKQRVLYEDINDYNIRLNLKREKTPDEDKIKDLIRTSNGALKYFRYKKRYTLQTIDNLFNIDLTVVKSSTSREVRSDNTKRMKRDVKDHVKKYVIKPDYIVDFNSWYDSLKDTDFVELMGKKYTQLIAKKNVVSSNVFKNPMEYEIEIEYIGNKLPTELRVNNDVVFEKLVENTGYILQSLHDNYFIISEKQKSIFFDGYKSLVKDFRFIGPYAISLENHNILERNYADYYNTINIRKGYSVTDKADGERNLLVILPDNGVFLMSRKNVVKYMGCKINAPLTILDGEYITKTKDNKSICLFMAFDIYFYRGMDVRNNILFRSLEDKKKDRIDKSRLEYLSQLLEEIEIEHDLDSIQLSLEAKKFYYGNADPFNSQIEMIINKEKEEYNSLPEDKHEEKGKIMSNIKSFKGDTEIFDHVNTILSREYIYETDGVIFTPIYLGVGEESNVKKKNQYSGRWHQCFKWKPSDLNTIDFLVEIKKDDMGKEEINYSKNDVGSVVPYKTLILKIGYDPKQHTRYNAFRVMNEALVFTDSYHPIPFQPTNPYIKDTHLLYIPLDNGSIKCKNGMIVNDGDIIECLYNKDAVNHINKWIPLKVREVLTPNDFTTANNVWKTIHNPITQKMMTTGNIPVTNEEIYYYNINKRSSFVCKPMNDFHSYLKKKMIGLVSSSGYMLLDMSCGKLGDLNHWLDADLGMIVGMDLNRDNLENVDNGACNRVLSAYINNYSPLLDNILLIWGDSSKNMKKGLSAKDKLNKYYLDIIHGNVEIEKVYNSKLRRFHGICSDDVSFGFDVVSCQFSIHYFFENEKTLDNFLENVSNSLKAGGKFIGTCFNGSRILEALKGKNSIESSIKDKIIWKIDKKYSDDLNVLPNNSECLNKKIDVYLESIGTTTSEYLVNMEYLKLKCKQYNLNLVTMNSFREEFRTFLDESISYGDAAKMVPELQEYSFFNDYFIFENNLRL
tara:strand:+ start:3207 stop:6407 length:3201 start_codon:yes stop_codon:yes gene_type:complete